MKRLLVAFSLCESLSCACLWIRHQGNGKGQIVTSCRGKESLELKQLSLTCHQTRFITQPKVDALLTRLNQMSQANMARMDSNESPVTAHSTDSTLSNPTPTVDTIGINRQQMILQKFTTTMTKNGMRRDALQVQYPQD